jgi:hypothetical protein
MEEAQLIGFQYNIQIEKMEISYKKSIKILALIFNIDNNSKSCI